ncbi:M16 family metallopeptidase [Thalassobellus suaedae]|uniref:Pitrilysin family protein n=1 Tax=Thalassobellus suaedae TaxID=3074124 RepID=A0ABY9Y4T2_9FLAO|nr:pitrilysin family protein [Flavobacteriaceae bacterium HL-DH10]
MKNTIVIFVICLAIISISFGQEKETPPSGSEPKNFLLPQREELQLENGVKLVMIPYGGIPKASVRITVSTGNIHEEIDKIWMSNLVSNLMQEGSISMSAKDIADKMANMGGDLNIFVTPHNTNIQSSVLYEFVPDAIALMVDVLINPAFPESEMVRLKNDMKRNLSVELTKPGSLATQEFFKQLYPNHPYGRYFPTEEMIDSYTLDDVKEFYGKNFGGKCTTIYIAGKFDIEKAKKAAVGALTNWKEGLESEYSIGEPVTQGEITLIDRPGAPQSTLLVGLPVADPSNPDYIAVDVMNSLLGGSFGSRITSNIREDKGYTYSPRSRVSAKYKSSIWYEQADVTTEFTGPSLQEISKEIERLRNEAPSEKELDGIKNYEAGLFVLRNSIPNGIIEQLVFLDVHDLEDDYLVNRVKEIYSLTPKDIQNMAKKYLRSKDMTLVIVGDKVKIQNQIDEYEKLLDTLK